jgi:hypothetical protein
MAIMRIIRDRSLLSILLSLIAIIIVAVHVEDS